MYTEGAWNLTTELKGLELRILLRIVGSWNFNTELKQESDTELTGGIGTITTELKQESDMYAWMGRIGTLRVGTVELNNKIAELT